MTNVLRKCATFCANADINCPAHLAKCAAYLVKFTNKRQMQAHLVKCARIWCYFPSLWLDKCKAQALFSIRGGQKQENQV